MVNTRYIQKVSSVSLLLQSYDSSSIHLCRFRKRLINFSFICLIGILLVCVYYVKENWDTLCGTGVSSSSQHHFVILFWILIAYYNGKNTNSLCLIPRLKRTDDSLPQLIFCFFHIFYVQLFIKLRVIRYWKLCARQHSLTNHTTRTSAENSAIHHIVHS